MPESTADSDAGTNDNNKDAQESQDAKEPKEAKDTTKDSPGSRSLTLTLSPGLLLVSALLVLSLLGNGVLGWLWLADRSDTRTAKSELATVKEDADSRQHAEQVALDYAKGAADMNFKDIPGWTKRLTANTSPELTKKLKEASGSMEQIIVPLQWVSTPTPIAAITRSEHDGVFVVNAFISVMTKNAQAPDGIQSTATYTVTVNKNDNWIITDVGGVDSAMKLGR